MLSDLVITQDQARSACESSSRWASLMLTVSVKGWMKSSESCKYVLGSKHSLPLKGKMLSGGEVLYLGFPGVVSSSQKCPGRKQPQWLLARPVETSGLLSGPQGLLLPREEEGGWEEGKARGGAIR